MAALSSHLKSGGPDIPINAGEQSSGWNKVVVEAPQGSFGLHAITVSAQVLGKVKAKAAGKAKNRPSGLHAPGLASVPSGEAVESLCGAPYSKNL
jgi:hypothetical protein